MKVAVIGDCKSRCFGNVAAALTQSDVLTLYIGPFGEADRVSKHFASIEDRDLIFCTHLEEHDKNLLERSVSGRVFYWHAFNFIGLHPDIISLKRSNPLGEYHSAIAVAFFLSGSTVSEAFSAYNALTYGRLGYFDLYEAGRKYWIEAGRQQNMQYDFAAAFERWGRRGNFMHSVNHPHSTVTVDIAQDAAIRAGLEVDSSLADIIPDDFTSGQICPVYPEIAHRRDFDGSYYWKARDDFGGTVYNHWNFLQACFDSYADASREELLANERIATTMNALGLGAK